MWLESFPKFRSKEFPKKSLQSLRFTPTKTNMTMENQPFEDIFPIENWYFPL